MSRVLAKFRTLRSALEVCHDMRGFTPLKAIHSSAVAAVVRPGRLHTASGTHRGHERNACAGTCAPAAARSHRFGLVNHPLYESCIQKVCILDCMVLMSNRGACGECRTPLGSQPKCILDRAAVLSLQSSQHRWQRALVCRYATSLHLVAHPGRRLGVARGLSCCTTQSQQGTYIC